MKRIVVVAIIATFTVLFSSCKMKPPQSFIKTFDEAGTWKTIEVLDNMDKDTVWTQIVDTLTQKYDIEVIQKDSGYIRTSWKFTYVRDDQVVENYRSRIVVKMLGTDWKTLQVKCESNWLSKDKGWLVGYDMRLLEDAYSDIQGKVGRVVR